ncbi:hypothetical protein [Phenylobacterium sp.]|uniref:hypothetical protein n=1 Tax=Phenylobacterium sp. TaxID=1871053 RepID=UPI002CAFA388|nr:hypothetical protein [Phenylobacterium sp.]HVI31375.1 hypothetical protein [Phenylobacterium sp.]
MPRRVSIWAMVAVVAFAALATYALAGAALLLRPPAFAAVADAPRLLAAASQTLLPLAGRLAAERF